MDSDWLFRRDSQVPWEVLFPYSASPEKKQYLQSDYKVRKKLESNKKKENFILYTFFRKEAA